MTVSPIELMRLALEAAHRGIDEQQSPFGCAIALQGEVVVACHNLVRRHTDITAHAEIIALREACRRLDRIHLPGCIVATTCEPCPMCATALHWSRVQTVYFGATISDAAEVGFNELPLPAAKLLKDAGSPLQIVDRVLQDECRQLLLRWKQECGNAY